MFCLCFVSGIKEAMGLLEDASIHGGILIVVSDGQEHKGPYIRDVYQEVKFVCN